MRLLAAAVVLAAAGPPTPAAAAPADEPGSITATTNFTLGAVSVGDVHGFLAPGGHFDLGFRVRRWRLAAEAQTGLWSIERPPEAPYQGGSFGRYGMALRYAWKELGYEKAGHRPAVRFRSYVELGVGRQRVRTDHASVARGDVMLGFGVAPEIRFGRGSFGASFGIRALVARAPDIDVIARGACSACGPAGYDLALLYMMGITFGR